MREQMVIHRAFDGEHEMSDACWCRPITVDADDARDADEIVAETETVDG